MEIVQSPLLMCSELLHINILNISNFSWHFMLVLEYYIVIMYLFEKVKLISLCFFSFNFFSCFHSIFLIPDQWSDILDFDSFELPWVIK